MAEEMIYPAYSFKINTEGAKPQIFDEFRKKWVVLSPEEWIRQHVLTYLQKEKGFPAGLTSVEAGIELNGLNRRCDVIYFSKEHQPMMIVECKAPDVVIDQSVFDQVWIYNMKLKVPFLLLTNGKMQVFARVSEGAKPGFMAELPDFETLNSWI
ncbi:MAG: type I restriction enzyme HsdR N-terminal domain-containing protein [Flavobacteriales bacterium]|nr:type I restriction enzyme HsdR N-terminal domain-containing protein [Flavobacteriales bacterium]